MTFTKTILPNGMRIITVPLADNPAVTVLVMAKAGSKYETKDINGLSHFLEHMCFKGTPRRPRAVDISRELDAIGAQYNAFTGQEYTGYYIKSHYKHTDKILDVVSDMYLNPVFDEKEIAKEKGVIIEEINMYEDMPQRHIQDLFLELLYGDQPAGWNIAGTRELVASMTRDHFVKYRSEHYVTRGTTVLVAGNIDEAKTIDQVTKLFASLEDNEKHGKEAVKEAQDRPQIKIQEKKTDQVHMVLGVRTFGVDHPDTITLRVLNAVLGGGMSSRLFQKLRDEMGVGYYVRSDTDDFTDHGVLSVATGVDTKRVPEVINAVLEEFRKFVREDVSEEELAKAKEYLIGGMYLSLESSDALTMFYGMQDALSQHVRTPEEISAKIQAVTAADIRRVAKDIFKDSGLNLALIGSTKREEIEPVFSLGVL